ncbi:mitochondrial peptide methionine sulfoxide reductase isoform X8 [Cavia porcellus]|uniref:mitochondrial peptide methionine sulfoxide reductase isoform X8 n=1 Tax=Cavia porcellus TaxID=10141 RepID=UPI002FDFF489
MLSGIARARQLLRGLLPGSRMGDSASTLVSPQEALPGRKEAISVAESVSSHCLDFHNGDHTFSQGGLTQAIFAKHHVNGNRTVEPFPEGTQMAVFGKTGHAEVIRVVYQPEHISFEELLKVFWENHDPTQGMRQGNDHGTQYRSAIYPTCAAQMQAALQSKEDYQKVGQRTWLVFTSAKSLSAHGFGPITTDIREGQTFYYAEDYHQQYLSKIPDGYCGLRGTGISCPLGIKK